MAGATGARRNLGKPDKTILVEADGESSLGPSLEQCEWQQRRMAVPA